jgi:transcription elongation GreA/GreB family factor
LAYIDEPVSLEDGLIEVIESTREPFAKWELVENYLRETKLRREQPSEAVLRHCYESLRKLADRLSRENPGLAGLAWVLALRVGRVVGIDAIPDDAVIQFRTFPDLRALFALIEDETLFGLACDCLDQARRDDWPDQLLALLPTLALPLCNRAVERLLTAGRSSADFEPVVQQILSAPVAHFEALLWLWDGPAAEEVVPVPAPATLLSRIVRALDECRRSETIPKETAKKIGNRARTVLSARRYKQFDRCVRGLEAGMATALRNQIKQLDNLGRAVREDLLRKLGQRFPDTESGEAVAAWEREDIVFVTEEGLARKREEIDHHVHVKMKENARAIGRAAAHGDLSENAEYKFALEERDLLRARLAQMNAEVAIARVITSADVPVDHAGVGTKLVFRRVSDGQPYEISLLGPWEADPQQGRFNYRTPLAQKVLGKAVGDTVEFEHTGAVGTYEIVALENALAPQE